LSCLDHRLGESPLPERAIESLDFVSKQTLSAPFVITIRLDQ